MRTFLRWLGGVSWVRRFYEGEAVILALHRVSRTPSLMGSSFCLHPERLQHLLLHLIKKGYTFISLEALLYALQADHPLHKAIVLTIDDGYADFLEEAYPILKQLKIPFTMYVVSSFAKKELFPWWVGLDHLIQERHKFILEGYSYEAKDWKKKKRLFSHLQRRYLRESPHKACGAIESAFRKAGLPSEKLYEVCLDTYALHSLSQDSLCRIGAHTVSHPWLPSLDWEKWERELSHSKAFLEAVLQRLVVDFAYPYGGPQDIPTGLERLLSEIGYRSAVTLRWSPVYRAHRSSPYRLPRRVVNASLAAEDFHRPRWRRMA
ncbi:MAG: polysaccharide deacetylase family protein [Bacteroidia bacterium]|nr:polysaccharide deacetylase family protein [Bacteroidia bacterium]MDW8014513.1 polysaccharide deacetylase family protein [Bacteroidia bacterium]